MKIVKVSHNGKITKKKLFCACDHPYPSIHIRTGRGYVDFPLGNHRCPVCKHSQWLYTRTDNWNGKIFILEELEEVIS